MPELDEDQLDEELKRGMHAMTEKKDEQSGIWGVMVKCWPASGLSKVDWSVLVNVAGDEGVSARHREDLERVARECRASSFGMARSDRGFYARLTPDGSAPLRYVRDWHGLVRQSAMAATILELSVSPMRFGNVLDRVRAIADATELPQATLVRAAGTIYVALLAHAADEESVARLAIACRELFALAENAGGYTVIEFCPTELKRRVNVWGPPRGDIELMRRLKQVFDPGGVLSPGRCIGGP